MKLESILRTLAGGLGAIALVLGIVALDQPSAKADRRTIVPKGPIQLQGAAPSVVAPTLSAAERVAALKSIVPKVGSGLLQNNLAKQLGIQTLFGGKPVNKPPSKLAPKPWNDIDHGVSTDYYSLFGQQNEPSIAINPVDPDIVVVGAHNTSNFSSVSNACSVYISVNGGLTFNYDSDVPLFAAAPKFCSDTVVRFSPDGFNLYITYLDINSTTFTDTVDVQVRSGFFPSIVFTTYPLLSSGSGNLIDKEWIDVHTWDNTGGVGAPFLYMTFTFFTPTNCQIYFLRNSNYGASADWDVLSLLANSTTCGGLIYTAPFRLVQGSRPAGGPGTNVLACWYDSGIDGWSTGYPVPGPPGPPLNKFNIACRSSADRGVTFAGGTAPPETTPGNWIYAASNASFEVPYYLGPNYNYFRYAGAHFPSVAIDPVNNAHIVYTYDPTSARLDTECGSVGYVRSTVGTATPPYNVWSPKTAAAVGFGAQFFPTVVSQRVAESLKPTIYIAYNDSSKSSVLGPANYNRIYDTFYKKSLVGGAPFGVATRISDHSSISDFAFIGDYIDSGASIYQYHVVWTDNRQATSIFQNVTRILEDRY